jgi:hypothetical protein
MAKQRLSFTTDGAGAATVLGSLVPDGALLYAVIFDAAATDNTCDVTLTMEQNGASNTVLTLTDQTAYGVYYPRVVEHGNTGTALTTTTPPLIFGVPKIVVAQGGATLSGSIVLLYTEL